MKNKWFFTGIFSILLVFGLLAVGCDDGGDGGSSDIDVTFSSVFANGSATVTTTELTLTFSQAIASLSVADITLSGVSGVTKGTLSGSGPTYTLGIGGITSGGTLSVAVTKSGYNIRGSPKTTTIYYSSGSNPGGDPIIITLDSNAPYGWQKTYEPATLFNGNRITAGDVYTFNYSFTSNVAMDYLQVVLVDNCAATSYQWITISDYVNIQNNISANSVVTGSVQITATGTATDATVLANRLVFQIGTGTVSQPTLTFTTLNIEKDDTPIPDSRSDFYGTWKMSAPPNGTIEISENRLIYRIDNNNHCTVENLNWTNAPAGAITTWSSSGYTSGYTVTGTLTQSAGGLGWGGTTVVGSTSTSILLIHTNNQSVQSVSEVGGSYFGSTFYWQEDNPIQDSRSDFYGTWQMSAPPNSTLEISEDRLIYRIDSNNHCTVENLNWTNAPAGAITTWSSSGYTSGYTVTGTLTQSAGGLGWGGTTVIGSTSTSILLIHTNMESIQSVSEVGGSYFGSTFYKNDNPIQTPSAPTGVTASRNSTTPTTVNISWTAVSGATSYRVYYSSTGTGSGTLEGSPTTTSFTSYNNSTSSTWYFRVTAVNSAGESSPSSWVSVGPVSGGGTTPNAPTGVTASRNSTTPTTVNISWNQVSGATSYIIQYSNNGGVSYAQDGTSTTTSYTSTGNSTNSTWYFRVIAVNSAGQSSPSTAVSVGPTSGGGGGTKLSTPTGLQWNSLPSDSYVQIRFNTVALAQSYKLYRATSANGTYTEITATGGSSGGGYILTDSNPRSGTSYYKVRAIPPSGFGYTESDLSDYVIVTR